MELSMCPEASEFKQPRERLFRACDACYTRKIKCDSIGSQCDWCAHHGLDCTFTRPGRRAGELPNDRRTSCNGNPNSTNSETLVSTSPVPLAQDVMTHYHLDLPDRRMLLQCVDGYEESILRLLFPVIDPELFRHAVNQIYSQSSPGRPSCSAMASLFCFFHFFNVLSLGPTKADEYGRDLLEMAQYLFHSILAEPASIDGVQALIMMIFLAPLSGNEELIMSYHSAALSMIFEMEGHANLSAAVSKASTHTRNLFWLCYTIDKRSFAGHYRPLSLIDDTLCDLSLPAGYVERLLQNMGRSLTSKGPFEGAVFPVDIRLSIIKSKIFTAFLSPTTALKPAHLLLQDIRVLDKELEDWRCSFPPHWKLTLSVSGTMPRIESAFFHLFTLRLDYYWCITNIHQAYYQLESLSSECYKLQECIGYKLQECIDSSFALCLEASRSALFHLHVASREFPTGALGFVVSYCLQNFYTVYCNILRNPQRGDVLKDLELIQNLWLAMDSFNKTQQGGRISGLQQVVDYVKSLSSAARMAVDIAHAKPA